MTDTKKDTPEGKTPSKAEIEKAEAAKERAASIQARRDAGLSKEQAEEVQKSQEAHDEALEESTKKSKE